MSDVIELVLALVGLVVGIVLMIAQFQLFAIRRLLEMLVAQTQAPSGGRLGPGVGNLPPLTPAQLHRPADADLPPLTPAQQKKRRIVALVFFTFLIVCIGFVIFALLSPK
jgi:hypothetical protein